MHLSTLLAYSGAWALLCALPGPDTALVALNGVVRGRSSAVRAALGSCTAQGMHMLAAGFGLSAVIASSAGLFTVLKFLGVVYLTVLGLRLILSRAGDAEAAPQQLAVRRNPYRRGLVTGLLNPKTAIFFLTFLPQFIDPEAALTPQVAMLLAATVTVLAAWHAVVIALSGRLRGVARRPRAREIAERLTGTAFVVLASRLATVTR